MPSSLWLHKFVTCASDAITLDHVRHCRPRTAMVQSNTQVWALSTQDSTDHSRVAVSPHHFQSPNHFQSLTVPPSKPCAGRHHRAVLSSRLNRGALIFLIVDLASVDRHFGIPQNCFAETSVFKQFCVSGSRCVDCIVGSPMQHEGFAFQPLAV